MKQMLNTSNISDFISKCTNYIYNTYIYYRTLHGGFFVTEHSTIALYISGPGHPDYPGHLGLILYGSSGSYPLQ